MLRLMAPADDAMPPTGPLGPPDEVAPGRRRIGPGARLGRYEIVARIGAGGMGEVFRARDAQIGREVAVKVVSGAPLVSAEFLRRFELEARAVGALNHVNILTIYDVGEEDGTPYLVTELLEGENLRAVLRRGRLAEKRAVELALQMCRGLAAAHDKGIFHRDLKPENLFLLKDGRLKVLDFGLAKLAGPTDAAAVDQTGAIVGTAGYLAPEVLRGEAADHRADLFAVGAILYEMLTGERAFKGSSPVESHHAALTETPSMGAVSIPLARVVQRCLEKAPEDRFQTARDLAFALSTLLVGWQAE
jgi:eukaryotic-like serine/threonine-protein kinase